MKKKKLEAVNQAQNKGLISFPFILPNIANFFKLISQFPANLRARQGR